jgi:hypothetical protein
MPADFSGLPRQAQARLTVLAERIGGMTHESLHQLRFNTIDLDPAREPSELIDQLSPWLAPERKYLYCLMSAGDAPTDRVCRAFAAVRDRRDGRAYARPNAGRDSRYLYVGSSRSLKRRFKEHLGFGAPGTYALQLAHWANDLDLPLELSVARYASTLPDEILQVLEDTLWDRLTPMFGRKGAR